MTSVFGETGGKAVNDTLGFVEDTGSNTMDMGASMEDNTLGRTDRFSMRFDDNSHSFDDKPQFADYTTDQYKVNLDQAQQRLYDEIGNRQDYEDYTLFVQFSHWLALENQKLELMDMAPYSMESEAQREAVVEKFKDRVLSDAPKDFAVKTLVKTLAKGGEILLEKTSGKIGQMAGTVLAKWLPKAAKVWDSTVGFVGQIDTIALGINLVTTLLLDGYGIYNSRNHPEWIKSVSNIPLIGNIVESAFNVGDFLAYVLGLSETDKQREKKRKERIIKEIEAIQARLTEKVSTLQRIQKHQASLDTLRDASVSYEVEADQVAFERAGAILNAFEIPLNTDRKILSTLARNYIDAYIAQDTWSESYRQREASFLAYRMYILNHPESREAIVERQRREAGSRDFVSGK